MSYVVFQSFLYPLFCLSGYSPARAHRLGSTVRALASSSPGIVKVLSMYPQPHFLVISLIPLWRFLRPLFEIPNHCADRLSNRDFTAYSFDNRLASHLCSVRCYHPIPITVGLL